MTRLDAPATARNRAPILAILERWLGASVRPDPIRVLEIASGTGQHAVFFAEALPHLRWQPSDPDPAHLESIEAWRVGSGLENLAAPIALDVRAGDWGIDSVDVLFNANMIHIAPWTAAEGLFAGAGRVLAPEGLLFLYGPFRVGDRHTAPSNEAFDADLRRRDPAWGVRDLERVAALAAAAGLSLVESNDMPANNKLLVFRLAPGQHRLAT
ncbi:MAG: DUF938 domain-containing protein [Deltaproteobacteria bacterium]|nr:DUF938 domain-containing protein [Deltaproteobacteria bacterium]